MTNKHPYAITQLRMAIFPPDSIGTASTDSGRPGQTDSHSCSEAVSGTGGGALDDVMEMPLGSWTSPTEGRKAYGELYGCDDTTHVGMNHTCDGSYRHFPGQTFGNDAIFEWTCPFTANYFLQVRPDFTSLLGGYCMRCPDLLSASTANYFLQITANCDVACERAHPFLSSGYKHRTWFRLYFAERIFCSIRLRGPAPAGLPR
jgi:hypothetical protein